MSAQDVLDFLLQLQKQGYALENLGLCHDTEPDIPLLEISLDSSKASVVVA